MLILKRVSEQKESLLNIESNDPYTVWREAKDHLSETDLVSLASLGVQDLRVRSPHNLRDLYINSKDSKKFIETVTTVRNEQGDAITTMTISREIDHSIDNPRSYPTDSSGLFTKSANGKIEFIPSGIAQCLKDLRDLLLKEGIRVLINITSNKGVSLNKKYHLSESTEESPTRATTLKVSVKYNKKNYSNLNVGSIQELKDFLTGVFPDNPSEVSLVNDYDFSSLSALMPKAKQARTISGILFFSMAQGADRNHKIGQLDFSYSEGKVNVVPTAAKKYFYGFKNGVLESF